MEQRRTCRTMGDFGTPRVTQMITKQVLKSSLTCKHVCVRVEDFMTLCTLCMSYAYAGEMSRYPVKSHKCFHAVLYPKRCVDCCRRCLATVSPAARRNRHMLGRTGVPTPHQTSFQRTRGRCPRVPMSVISHVEIPSCPACFFFPQMSSTVFDLKLHLLSRQEVECGI